MDIMPVPELIHFILCWCQYNNLDIFCHLTGNTCITYMNHDSNYIVVFLLIHIICLLYY